MTSPSYRSRPKQANDYYKRNPEKFFSPVTRELILSRNISRGAKELLEFAMSCTDTFTFTVPTISRRHQLSERHTQRLLAELRELGLAWKTSEGKRGSAAEWDFVREYSEQSSGDSDGMTKMSGHKCHDKNVTHKENKGKDRKTKGSLVSSSSLRDSERNQYDHGSAVDHELSNQLPENPQPEVPATSTDGLRPNDVPASVPQKPEPSATILRLPVSREQETSQVPRVDLEPLTDAENNADEQPTYDPMKDLRSRLLKLSQHQNTA